MFVILPLALVIGIAVIVLTVMKVERGLLRVFLLTAGASLVGFPVFSFLHNAVYGALIHFFGEGFWKGGDEPFFFIIAVIICPLGFIVGIIGSIKIAVKRRISENKKSREVDHVSNTSV